jgi:hypothetical protein
MITTAILGIIYAFIFAITSPLRLLADVSLDSNFASSIQTASGYYHAVNGFIPVDTMLTILGISLVFEGLYLTYKLIMWVIKKIPGIS